MDSNITKAVIKAATAAKADLSARFWGKDWQSLQTFWNKCDGTAMGCRAGQWQSIDWRRGAKAEHGSRA